MSSVTIRWLSYTAVVYCLATSCFVQQIDITSIAAKSSKPWFVYISENIISTNMYLHQCNEPICILSKLPHQVRRGYDWCSFTKNLPKRFIANYIRNAPCGKLNVESQQFPKLFWEIRVPPVLTILVKFLRFEIEDSVKRCPHSVMVLTEYYDRNWRSRGKSWVFCGRRVH